MPNRVQISGSTGWYTFPINPVDFNDEDNIEINIQRTIDGYSFEMIPIFDGRPRTMQWNGLPNKSPYSSMVAQLKTFIGETVYIRLNDLSKSEGTSTPFRARVINVETKIRSGAGSATAVSKLVYDFIKLTYVNVN